MKFKAVIIIVVCLASVNVFSQNITIDSLLIKINKLENDNLFIEAKNLINSNINNDDNWFELSKELIYVNEKLGLHEENLKIFKEANQKGYFYFIHPAMPKYKPYKQFEKFTLISQEDLKLLNESNKKSETIYEIQLPDNFDDTKNYPLIFLLHGGGKNINDVKKHWQVDELNQKFVKVYIQSFRHFDSKTYSWGLVNERLIKDFKNIYHEIRTNYKIDTTSVFMGSISAGANAVIEIALRAVIPVKGCVVYCPGIPGFLMKKEIQLIKNHDLKVFIVAGESDHFLSKQKILTELFDSLSLDYKYTIVRDMGHQYPDNEDKYVQEGLKFILNKNQFPQELDIYIKQRIKIGYDPGISIGIIDSTGTNFYNYGKAFNNSEATPNENTIYEIGSVAKIFTTNIYSILLEQKVFNEDNTVGDFISKSELKGSVREIKLIDLTTHTSGLPALPTNINLNMPGNFTIGYERDDLFKFLNDFQIPTTKKYIYSNTGISLLAIVMEKATGKTYKELLDKFLLHELNMKSTFLKVPEKETSSFADGSSLCVEKDHWDLSNVFVPVGGVKSSVSDLSKLLKVNLELLDYKYSESFIRSIEIQDEISENNYSGIGWKITKENNDEVIWHSGNTGGFAAFVGFNYKQKKGCVVLSNSNISVDQIGWKILDEKKNLKELKNHICFKLSKIIQEESLDSAWHFYVSESKKDKSNYIMGEIQFIELANAYATFDINLSNEIYDIALTEFPKSLDIYLSASKHYSNQNKKDKAVELLQKIQKEYPENIHIKNMLNELQ